MSRRITSFFCGGLITTLAIVATSPLDALAWKAEPIRSSSTPQQCRFGGNPQGSFRRNTHFLVVDWNNDRRVDECFGIAPDRSIWHIWNGSGGWRTMPNGGRADNVYPIAYTGRDTRYVQVCVYNSGVWASRNLRGTWGPWYLVGRTRYCR
jgi:hypothetical protein